MSNAAIAPLVRSSAAARAVSHISILFPPSRTKPHSAWKGMDLVHNAQRQHGDVIQRRGLDAVGDTDNLQHVALPDRHVAERHARRGVAVDIDLEQKAGQMSVR